jgi:hypothetical protein
VHGGAVPLLHVQQHLDQRARFFRHSIEHAQNVLRAIAEADPALPQAELIEREVARPVLGRVALARVVDVDHRVEARVGRLHFQARQVAIPEGTLGRERRVDSGGISIFHRFFARGLGVRGLSELGDEALGLAGAELTEVMEQRTDVVAAQRLVVAELCLVERQRMLPGAVFVVAEEAFAVGFERGHRQVRGQVVDHRVLVHECVLHEQQAAAGLLVRLALHRLGHPVGVVELLERVEVGVFDDRDRIDRDRLFAQVRDLDVAHDRARALGNEHGDLGADPVELADVAVVAEPDVTLVALVRIERGHEERREHSVAAGFLDAQVQSFALEVRRRKLRDVFDDAVQRRIGLAEQRAAGVVDDAAEAHRADVVDPLDGGLRRGDHVLARCVVEISVLHGGSAGSLTRGGPGMERDGCVSSTALGGGRRRRRASASSGLGRAVD